MITAQARRVIVLELTDELLAQLQPFMAGLNITTTPHSDRTDQEDDEHSQFEGYTTVEQRRQRLTMCSEAYDALIARVGGALDYDVRWRPNEYEPDGFVERVCPLQLTTGGHQQAGCPQCGVHFFANRTEVVCACGQVVSVI